MALVFSLTSSNSGTSRLSLRQSSWKLVERLVNQLTNISLEWAGRRHLARDVDQLAVFAFDHIGHQVNIFGIYEREDLDTFFAWAHDAGIDFLSGCAIDIGANIGNHSIYFADRFKSVLSFEPNRRVFELLRLNATLRTNIVCENVGLSDRHELASLQFDASNIGAGKISEAGGLGTPAQLRCLDEWRPSDTVKLIKIDVEGHEPRVLRGAGELIREHRPFILFEQHESEFVGGTTPTIELVKSLGYDQFGMVRRPPGYGAPWVRKISGALEFLISGRSYEFVLIDRFEPDFYPFVVAIPDWAKGLTREPDRLRPAHS